MTYDPIDTDADGTLEASTTGDANTLDGYDAADLGSESDIRFVNPGDSIQTAFDAAPQNAHIVIAGTHRPTSADLPYFPPDNCYIELRREIRIADGETGATTIFKRTTDTSNLVTDFTANDVGAHFAYEATE